MPLKKPTNKAIQLVFLSLTAQGPAEWNQIVAYIRERFEVKDWIKEVRVYLQVLTNHGYVVRDPDIRKEVYHITDVGREYFKQIG